ncbi:MAG: hypothetical protein DSO07_02260 [Thermoproteota archaeon]|uniref:CPBP family intramembrane metalloprotease n=1 Tax=Candidatus Methanodesulfokora washburnensis TaxID=2478471 RepID=A0A429GGX4_9CREN|nr:CPBP family intramembrane glutamic endopeptidase [Candidatus Methanodesulfokores washburnensis]RSN72909.1 CPBP family intramembrane metalloprotease [Candidatus Methanodesulfokores washburnensis]TDA41871.1 MAG: hypothetical protein DSO07_02260 [Candidatus Korarchaeota archaeon]
MSFRSLISIYVVVSFGLALIMDLALCSSPLTAKVLYSQPQPENILISSLAVIVWGLLRMYAPTAATAICLHLEGRSVRESIKKYVNFSARTIKHFLLAPLIVYLAFGIFLLLSVALGVLSIDKFVKIVVKGGGGLIKEDFARILLIVGLIADYPLAITINSFYALGEEIGWRGYLFDLMGRRDDLRSTIVIGSIWSLWHSTAIILLGFDYPHIRAAGIPLFTILCIAFTAPMLRLTSISSSILPAVSLHGAINAIWKMTLLVAFPSEMMPPTPLDEIYGGFGLIGIFSWLITAVIVLIATKKR